MRDSAHRTVAALMYLLLVSQLSPIAWGQQASRVAVIDFGTDQLVGKPWKPLWVAMRRSGRGR
jgi:hypothetical protein